MPYIYPDKISQNTFMCYIIFNLQKPCDPFSLKQTHLPATKINEIIKVMINSKNSCH